MGLYGVYKFTVYGVAFHVWGLSAWGCPPDSAFGDIVGSIRKKGLGFRILQRLDLEDYYPSRNPNVRPHNVKLSTHGLGSNFPGNGSFPK